MVLRPGGDALEVLTTEQEFTSIGYEGWRWTSRSPSQILHPGDVVYLSRSAHDTLRLAQVSQVQGALISLNPSDGSIMALVGGFDFAKSKFNRATQALRQPGSNIKPFIYSAALEKGFTPATLVSGAPVVIEDNVGGDWRPQNYSKKVFDRRDCEKPQHVTQSGLGSVGSRTRCRCGTRPPRKFGFDQPVA